MDWKWTQQAVGDGLTQEELAAEMAQTEDFRVGRSLLRALAREDGSPLEELEPGVYWLPMPMSTIEEV